MREGQHSQRDRVGRQKHTVYDKVKYKDNKTLFDPANPHELLTFSVINYSEMCFEANSISIPAIAQGKFYTITHFNPLIFRAAIVPFFVLVRPISTH